MKRTQHDAATKPSKQPRVIEPHHLARARGGANLGITVSGGRLPEDHMQQQHNEALIRLQSPARPVARPGEPS
jgi:hypothetical protein